jgi:DNA helicase-2/ATP-dependent DNA helicase PcrA
MQRNTNVDQPVQNLSPQQKAFLAEAVTGTSSIVLIAVAGAGKTTCIRMAAKMMRGTSAILAYNKKIAQEIKQKLQQDGVDWKKAEAGTVHSFGYRALRKAFKLGDDAIDAYKVSTILDQWIIFGEVGETLSPFAETIVELVSHAKNRAIGVIRRIEDVDAWMEIVDHHDMLDGAPEGALENIFAIIAVAQKLLVRSNQMTDRVDFDDMIYLPLIYPVKFWQYDTVFIDEAQDTNAARRELVKRLVKRTGKIIAVGDPRQAIYGFTGADADSLDLIKRDFKAKEMPLTITYRCPKNVVAFARRWVNHIEAAPTAPEGSVTSQTFEDMVQRQDLDRNSAILCRNTKPLVQAAFALIRLNIACRIEGRDIGGGLKKLATRWKSIRTLNALDDKLDEWKKKEVAKAKETKKDRKVQEIEDKVDTLKVIMDRCREEGQHNIEHALAYIDRIFGDNVTDVMTLSTIHKSKGREWNRVFWLDRVNTCPSKAARQMWEFEQENNLQYVAATRAMSELVDLFPPVAASKRPQAANSNESKLIPASAA